MLNKTNIILKCICGYNGNDFTDIIFVLNDSVVTIKSTNGNAPFGQ